MERSLFLYFQQVIHIINIIHLSNTWKFFCKSPPNIIWTSAISANHHPIQISALIKHRQWLTTNQSTSEKPNASSFIQRPSNSTKQTSKSQTKFWIFKNIKARPSKAARISAHVRIPEFKNISKTSFDSQTRMCVQCVALARFGHDFAS